MNKSDLIEHVAMQADLSKAAAARALESIIDGIQHALRRAKPSRSWALALSACAAAPVARVAIHALAST